MPKMPVTVCLGGHDLEMVEIAQLLTDSREVTVHDLGLPWGARASSYDAVIRASLAAGHPVVLIELLDDLPSDFPRDSLHWIDHHGPAAGRDVPTAIEQVFRYFDFSPQLWTRDLALVAANDRGHLAGLEQAGATTEEMRDIRRRDRAAQGITPEEERSGREAAEGARSYLNGLLTVVRLPHARTATVTDVLDARLGGPGYTNLLVLSPSQTTFFGYGRAVERLRVSIPGGWYGGDLPEHGFWGVARAIPLPELIPLLGPVMTVPSHELQVKKYRNILLWPLLLRGPEMNDDPPLQAWARVFGDDKNGGWKPNDPPKTTDAPPIYQVPDGIPYEEVVYFHPFVRDFLYGDGKTEPKDRAVHHLSYTRAKRVRVTFTTLRFSPMQEDITLQFQVDRVELYLCKSNVAMFVVEVSEPEHVDEAGQPVIEEDKQGGRRQRPVTLAHILDFQDQFRRIYPPFWYPPTDQDPTRYPGLCPKAVDWLDDRGVPLVQHDCTADPSTFKKFTKDGAEPPVFAHWQHFFGTVRSFRTRHDLEAKVRCYQHIMDERMPAMIYLAVKDPSQITLGDYDRLTFLDAAGTDDFPYNPEFLRVGRDRHNYDRFAHYGTRFLFSGYGFSVIGRDEPCFFVPIIQNHFRHHYFKIGLLAHFLRASLLGFADELSEAVKKLRGRGDAKDELSNPQFRDEVQEIQNRFLKFRSRAWFPEVTNQQQGSELHQMWFAQLSIDVLFRQVDDTSDRLHAALAEYETRQLTKAQKQLAELQVDENEKMKELAIAQHKLAIAAQWGLGISIVFAALSAVFAWMALFREETRTGASFSLTNWGPWMWLLLGGGVASIGVGILVWQLRKLNQSTTPTKHN